MNTEGSFIIFKRRGYLIQTEDSISTVLSGCIYKAWAAEAASVPTAQAHIRITFHKHCCI